MTERTDRELLELAAKAAGIEIQWDARGAWEAADLVSGADRLWNPLEDDGDALRLAVKLNMNIRYESRAAGVLVIVVGAWDGAPPPVEEVFEDGARKAVRRAIVRAASQISLGMENHNGMA